VKPDLASVDRLGFEAWADNLIVNALEDMAGERLDMHAEDGDVTLVIRTHAGQATASVRAYVAGRGWQHHDRVVHLKGGRP
jgi:hypothetical protein